MTMANTENRGSQDQFAAQGGSAREQIRDVKNQVVDQAKNTLQQARDRARSSLGESKGQVAEQISSVAEALRRTTEHLRGEDQTRIAGLTESLAGQIDQLARYLRDKDAAAMRNDLENFARRQPGIVLGGALVLGLIGARFIKSSERRRERRWSDGGRDYESRYDTFQEVGPGSSSGSFSGAYERGYSAGGYVEGGTGGGYAGA